MQLDSGAAVAPARSPDLYRLADALHERGDPQGAIELLGSLVAQTPHHAAARLLLGIALADLGQFDRAIVQFRRAVMADPGNAAAWSNLGMVLKIEGTFDEAVAAGDHAVACAPDAPQIRLNRAITLLRAGRLAEAWHDYEWRLRQPGQTQRLPPERLLPTLSTLPESALRGHTVLVTHEEGYGDTLQFLRYTPLLAAHGMRVLAWVPPSLARLVHGVACLERVIVAGEPLPHTDYHCPVFSLPRVFETTLDSIPTPLPYCPDPTLQRSWAARIPPARRRVGLVWAGQARPWLPGFSVLDSRRSLPLAALAPLAQVPDTLFVSLQKGDPASQPSPSGLRWHDPMPEATDFADTAAIIAQLDAVVSVDTSVAHLAASMGKPVLLLDRYDSCWRWFAGREDSPWYPTLRIFRQGAIGEWAPVIARVATALSQASLTRAA